VLKINILHPGIFFAKYKHMTDKGQKEMQDLLKEGAAALKEMRKGIENACAELRALYSKPFSRGYKRVNLDEKEIYKKQNNQRSNIAYN